MRLALITLASAALLAAADPQTVRGPLQLSLKRAVELAASPQGNARIQISGESLEQAKSRSAQSRAALLPDLAASLGTQNRTANLAAMGISVKVPIPGFQFPTFVGPYSTVDARITGTQSIFDFASIRRFQASKAGVSASAADLNSSEEQVAAQVSRAYLTAVRADADLEVARANQTLSEAVLRQAERQKEAGTGTGIEVTRARVQLANSKQRVLVAENQRRAAALQLLRAIGLRLDTELELTDKLQYVPVDQVTLDQAKDKALKQRPDLQAQQDREATARLNASATKLERLPSLSAFADYGSIGTGFDQARPTRTYGVSLRVPIFDGGRRDARRTESASQYRVETVKTRDMKEQIELDIRLALDSLKSAEEQVQVARDGLDLARNELEQAQRRYEAGVTTGIEVTDAQTRLERAQDNMTAALYGHNLARIDLAQAMGNVRSLVD